MITRFESCLVHVCNKVFCVHVSILTYLPALHHLIVSAEASWAQLLPDELLSHIYTIDESKTISVVFVVVGSLLSSLPWPLRLPFPADPSLSLSLSLSSGIREKTLLPPTAERPFSHGACPWGCSAGCCQTNTAKIIFTHSSLSTILLHFSLFSLYRLLNVV